MGQDKVASILEEQLDIGRPVSIGAVTADGHVQFTGRVSAHGSRHFKVTLDRVIPADVLVPQQKLKVRLVGASTTLPMTCRFLRMDRKKRAEMVLSFPEGEWITNRRAFARAPIGLEAQITRNRGQVLRAKTLDVGGGGLLVVSADGNLTQGETVHVTLHPPGNDDDAMAFEARVVRVTESHGNPAYGLKFVDVRTRDQNRICRMVIVEQFEQRRAELREISGRSESQ